MIVRGVIYLVELDLKFQKLTSVDLCILAAVSRDG